MPVWLIAVLGIGVMSLVAIVVYFLTSTSAKANAEAFKAKVLKIVEILKGRVERLEELLEEANAKQAEAEARAREAEDRAQRAEAQRDGADAEVARRQREKARRAQAVVRDVESALERAKASQRQWAKEANSAEGLTSIAGSTLSVASVTALRTIVNGSALLKAHESQPAEALTALDEALLSAEADARAEVERVSTWKSALGDE